MKKIYLILFGLISLSLINTSAYAKLSDGDRQALEGFYEGTNGPSWTRPWPWDPATKKFTKDPTTDPAAFPGLVVNANTGFVTEINLANNNLNGSIPANFNIPTGVSALNKLKVLNLSNNSGLSGEVPSEFIGFMASLETLKLSTVQLSGSLPANIGELTKLETFDISYTGINAIPESIGNLSNLVTLNLTSNNISTIPSTIYQLNKLTSLNLSYNKLVDLPASTVTSTQIMLVDLRGNKLDFCDFEAYKTGFPNSILLAAPQKITLPETVNVSVAKGESIDMQTTVCGTNNTYQWYKNGAILTGKTSKTLTISNASNTDIGYYQCSVTNPAAQNLVLQSKKFILTISPDWGPNIAVTNVIEDTPKDIAMTGYYTTAQLIDYFTIYINNGNSMKLELVSGPKHGTVIIPNPAIPSFRYTPNTDYFGQDTLIYKLTSGSLTNTGIISFDVLPVNDAPVLSLFNENGSPLSPFELNVKYGETVKFKAIMDDSKDKNLASTLTLTKKSSSLGGSITYDLASQLGTYRPSSNTTASDITTLVAKENGSTPKESGQKVATFKIQEVITNTPPVTSNVNIEVEAGQVVRFAIPANDAETALANLRVNIVSSPSNSSYFNWWNGEFIYLPKPGFSGTDQFKFTVTDNKNSVSNESTVTIVVKAPPVINLPETTLTSNLLFTGNRMYDYYRTYTYYYRYQRWYYSGYQYYYRGSQFNPSNVGMQVIKKIYPNSYITVNANSYIYLLRRLNDGSYTINYNYSYLSSLISSYQNGYSVVAYLNRYKDSRKVTVNHHDAATGRIIATQQVSLATENGYTYYSTRYYYRGYKYRYYNGNEEMNNPELDLMAMEDSEFDSNFKSSFLEDPVPPIDIPDSLLFEEPTDTVLVEEIDPFEDIVSSITTSRDTVSVNYGEATTLTFLGTSIEGQVEMQIKTQPTQGTLTNFKFDVFENEISTKYTGSYTASANTASIDSIVYTVFNAKDTVSETKIIRVLPVKSPPTMATLTDQSIDEDTEYTLDLNIADADTPFSNLNIITNITSDDTSFVASLTGSMLKIVPPANYNGSAFVEVSVVDLDGLQTSSSFTLTVNSVNDAPEINVEEAYTTDYNQEFSLVVSTSDIDGESAVLTVSGTPDWLEYVAAGTTVGTFTGTPKGVDAGVYAIKLTATDASTSVEKTFQITVVGPDVDSPPTLANAILPVELAKGSDPVIVDVNNTFTDLDGDPVTVTISGNTNSDWLSANLTSEGLVVTIVNPSYTGLAVVTLTGESKGLTTTTNATFYSKDEAPVVSGSIDEMDLWKNSADVSISLAGVVTDPDGDAITYSVASNTLPEMVTPIVDGETLTLKFASGKGGASVITLKGTAFGKSAESSFIVNVKDASPALNAEIPDQVLNKKDSLISIDLSNTFTDPDDTEITITVTEVSKANIVNISIIENTMFISPVGAGYGVLDVTIQGKTNDKFVNDTFTIEVKDVAPKVSVPIQNQVIPKNGNDVQIDVSTLFSDEDDPIVTPAILSVSDDTKANVTLTGNSLVIEPIVGMSGTFSITIQGTSAGKTVDFTFSVTLVDKAPVVATAVANQSVYKNNADIVIDLANLFTDEDDTDMTLSVKAVSNSDLVTASLSGNALTIKIAAGKAGAADVTILGTSGGKTVESTFSVTVEDRAPELVSALAAVAAKENDAPVKIELSSHFKDADGDAFTYKVNSNSNSALVTTTISGSELSLTFVKDKFGSAEIEIAATADGKSVTSKFTVTVAEKVGIFNTRFSENMSIYPLPANQYVNLDWKGNSTLKNVKVTLADLSGRVLIEEAIETLEPAQMHKIDLSRIASGIYFMTLSSDEFRLSQKLIKQ
ncbi:MAG: Ig-like domain-containing protein [Prolixibacteraceae bacterium]